MATEQDIHAHLRNSGNHFRYSDRSGAGQCGHLTRYTAIRVWLATFRSHAIVGSIKRNKIDKSQALRKDWALALSAQTNIGWPGQVQAQTARDSQTKQSKEQYP